jgi:APA family basic amino acid/polyamine antiporter
MERPYRAWGYPVTPIAFILFAAWLVGNTILEKPMDSLKGSVILLAGLPLYFYWRRSAVSRQPSAISQPREGSG